MRPQLFGKFLLIASTSDSDGTEPQMPRELDTEMPQTTNALHTHQISTAKAGVAKGVVCCDARAKQGGGIHGIEFIGNRRDGARFRDHHLRVSSVDSHTGYHRVLTVHAVSASAWFACAVFAGDQTDTDALAGLPLGNFAAHGLDAAYYLVAGNTRQSQTGIGAVHGGRIGMTDSACLHAYANLPGSGLGIGPLDYSKDAGCRHFDRFICAFHRLGTSTFLSFIALPQ